MGLEMEMEKSLLQWWWLRFAAKKLGPHFLVDRRVGFVVDRENSRRLETARVREEEIREVGCACSFFSY